MLAATRCNPQPETLVQCALAEQIARPKLPTAPPRGKNNGCEQAVAKNATPAQARVNVAGLKPMGAKCVRGTHGLLLKI
eukprot:7074114-Alexandrium_andersonii.AAC.1